jgi:hypothetical protein
MLQDSRKKRLKMVACHGMRQCSLGKGGYVELGEGAVGKIAKTGGHCS